MKKNTPKSGSGFNQGLAVGVGLVSVIAGGIFLYGPNGKTNRKQIKVWTVKAKAEVLEEIEKMKEVTQEKYEIAVDKVTDKYGKLKTVGKDQALVLAKELKRHWKSVVGEIKNRQKK